MFYYEAVTGGDVALLASQDAPAMVLYENIFSIDATFSSETSDGLGDNCLNGQTNDFWTPASMPATIIYDGALVAADCLLIAGHTLGTDGASVTLATSPDGAIWTDVLSFSPADDSVVMASFLPRTAKWRITVSGPTAPSVAVVMLGSRLSFPAEVLLPYTPLYQATEDELLFSGSWQGHFIRNRVIRKGATGTINFAPFERAWTEGAFVPFKNAFNAGEPFGFSPSPAEFPLDASYCSRNDTPLSVTFSKTNSLTQVIMEVKSYVR